MATELSPELKEQVIGGLAGNLAQHVDEPIVLGVPGPLAGEKLRDIPGSDAAQDEARKEEDPLSSSSYTLASDQSLYSHQVDSWLRGGVASAENHGIQYTRMPFAPRSNVAPTSSLDPAGLWYLMAMILPLFSMNNGVQWGWCTPETVMNAGELLITHVSRFCHDVRAAIRRLAQEQLARDLFATVMDIVLIIYAIGFLILSLYQACFFD